MNSPAVLLALCALGVAGGLLVLWRGLSGYRTAVVLGDTATSRSSSLAAGEVRVSGTIEAGEATLVSPLQSVPCVWYRAEVRSSGRDDRSLFREERAVGFRVRDAEGTIRVFPAGARIGAAKRFSGSSGLLGDAPPGLNPRTGSVFGPRAEPTSGESPLDREAAIAALLTVHQPVEPDPTLDSALRAAGSGMLGSGPGRDYEESRLEPGDVVTIVGTALPFGQLPDPAGADRMDRSGDPLTGLDDPEVAAEVAEARAAGELLTPDEAWGNAAIPGFGIGRPVRAPELDPEADRPAVAPEADAAATEARFDIDPDTLVLAASEGAPLLIVEGSPAVAVAREQGRFLVGLLGGALAIGCAIVAAIILGGPSA
jgi:hypothetical protein